MYHFIVFYSFYSNYIDEPRTETERHMYVKFSFCVQGNISIIGKNVNPSVTGTLLLLYVNRRFFYNK